MSTIGVVLTAYKRIKNIREQMAAITGQTIKPSTILIWQNTAPDSALPPDVLRDVIHVQATPNLGVWPRFSIGLELKTDYLCVFDDDTIPGSRWFENCLTTMQTHRGVLGTVGVTFQHVHRQGGAPGNWTRVGWPAPNDQPVEVDIVGHSWFFERDWLRYCALEPRCGQDTCGEDYHLSVSIQKHLKLGTYVPPHPADNRELWGSIKGIELGTDSVALYKQRGENSKKADMHQAYVANGWQPLIVRKGDVRSTHHIPY